MTDAAPAQGVVVGAGSGGAGERAEGPLVHRVAESAVAGVAGQHDGLAAGGTGDRRGARVVLARSRVAVAMWVVSEFGEHPGTEHDTQAGQAGVDLSVRVPAKTLAE